MLLDLEGATLLRCGEVALKSVDRFTEPLLMVLDCLGLFERLTLELLLLLTGVDERLMVDEFLVLNPSLETGFLLMVEDLLTLVPLL